MTDFTVITPMYNAACTVAETIVSVQNQTLSNWRMFIMDDGSSDDSVEIATRAARQDPRIEVILNGRVKHIGVLRNRALQMATAAYATFLDADDVWQPNFLAVQRELMLDANASVVHSAAKHLVDGTVIDVQPRYRGPRVCDPPSMIQYLCPQNPIYSPSAMIRYEVIMAEGGFSELPDHFSVLDTDLWLRLAAKYRFAYNPTPLLNYRVSALSLSSDPSNFLRNSRGEISAIESAIHAGADLPSDLIKRLRHRLGRCQVRYARLLFDQEPPDLDLAQKELRKALQNGFYEPRYLPFEVLAYPSRVLPYHLHRVIRWLRLRPLHQNASFPKCATAQQLTNKS